jgi:predicted ArsR family transcriptional regulator
MQTTRQRILTYLKQNQQVTASQLAIALDKTQANIRHHLGVLQQDGHIEIVGTAPQKGAGRPTHVYMLTKGAQENALDHLASALLDHAIPTRHTKNRTRKLQSIANKLIRSFTPAKKSITLRIGDAVQRLDELQYNARWEAHIDSPKILFFQCPYAKIIQHHPELCEMDALLISSLTGVECQQELKISRTQDGPDHCQFALKINTPKENYL